VILYYVGGKPIHPGKAIDDPESGSLRSRLSLSSLPLAVSRLTMRIFLA